LKSPEFLNLNFQGKMPLLVSDEGLVISESDSISRFILDRYSEKEPTFIPKDCGAKYMSETIVRTHDLYISNLQGCMYKAPGTLFSIYGLDRKAALHELLRQLHGIDKTISEFRKRHSLQESYPFLCGNEISLADATLFPTMVFCDFMLPQFFGYKQSDFMGPVLREWYTHLSNEVSCAKEVQSEITSALMDWKSNGRWDAIVAEIK
jgi:glutathione S-transferase